MSWTEAGEPAQELLAALQATRARWESICGSTARADRQAAEAGVGLAYAAAGLPQPHQIIWCASPIGLAHCWRQGSRNPSAGANVKAAVVDAVVRSVARAVELATPRAFRNRLWSEAQLTPPAPLSRSVLDAVHTSIRAEQRHAFPIWRHGWWRRWLDGSGRRQRALTFEDSSFSSHDGPPLAIYGCLYESGSLQRQTAPLRGLLQLAATAGWVVPHETVCWVSDRPDVLKADTQGRLHAADGPALRFTDGWAYYAWKGVHVPTWLIEEKATITASHVNREPDPVIRRCMIDLMTPARYIATSDAVCVSRDETGSLWLKSWHHWDSWAAVEVVNGTPEPDGSFKHYVLQVPPTMRTAREAVAWTYGLSEHEYARLRLRT